MFIDSHCHLQFFEPFALKVEDLMAAAKQNQIEQILCVATHLNQYQELRTLSQQYQELSISIGLHPNEKITQEPALQDFLALLTDPKIVAIGETGLDYYHLTETPAVQQQRFRTQIRVAIASKKPLIVHTREAKDDTLRILAEEHANTVGGVIHCFTGDLAFAKQAIALNFCLSFSGIITFPKAQDLQAIAKWLPLEQLLIETDAPYLAPEPFRGKTNKPAYLRYIAEYLAKLRNLEIEEFAKIIRQNYYRVFG
jgi:TatD DNase family protein